MEGKLNHLKELLTRQIELHEALKTDLQRELARDGAMDGAALLTMQQAKNRKVAGIQEMEHERQVLLEEIAAAWGLPPAELTLRRIIPRAPDGLTEALGECHQRLLAVMEDIQGLAKVTAANANARLKAIDATLAIISEVAQMHPTYSEKGRLQKLTPTFKETSV